MAGSTATAQARALRRLHGQSRCLRDSLSPCLGRSLPRPVSQACVRETDQPGTDFFSGSGRFRKPATSTTTKCPSISPPDSIKATSYFPGVSGR